MNEQRSVSILIPYKKNEGGVVVFLQKRAKDAKRLPDWFGFFGGGSEGDENAEETLMREIKEELNFDVAGYKFLGHYEFLGSIKDIYFLEVDNTFESIIKIGEGEYGRFFSEDEIEKEEKLILEDKTVLGDFYRIINK